MRNLYYIMKKVYHEPTLTSSVRVCIPNTVEENNTEMLHEETLMNLKNLSES